MSLPDDASAQVPPSEAVVRAVADHEGVAVTDIEPPEYEPLYAVIDPEALDRLFAASLETDTEATVTLPYDRYEVVVHADGRVEVTSTTTTTGQPCE